MRMKSLILIVIALGCGLVASIGISQVMTSGSGSGNVEMEKILVALNDIDIGTKLDAQNVKLEEWPKAKVPEGAVRRFDDVKDNFTSARFYKGEPLHVSKITDNPKSVADGVPIGFRALPVKVEEDTVMKAISPGDRVDVNVFLRKNEDIPTTGVFTILKNVRVFAVNTNTERSGNETGGKGESTNFRTISLLVKVDQSRDLSLAAQMGKILLTLRRVDDPDEDLGNDVTPIDDILGGKAKVASEAPTPGSTRPSYGGGGLLETIQSAVTPAVGSSSLPVSQAEKSMELWTPNTVEKYDWFDVKKMPVKSTAFAAGAEAPSSLNNTPAPTAEPTPPAEPTSTTPPDGPTHEGPAPGRPRY
jgi:pilus assembly protein CpaB